MIYFEKGEPVTVETSWQVGWSKRRRLGELGFISDIKTERSGKAHYLVTFNDWTRDWVHNGHIVLRRENDQGASCLPSLRQARSVLDDMDRAAGRITMLEKLPGYDRWATQGPPEGCEPCEEHDCDGLTRFPEGGQGRRIKCICACHSPGKNRRRK